MADSNTSLDFSNLENLLQDKVHPVEDRQKKNELFKAFLSEVLSETLQSPEIENIGKYSFEIREVNITEEFESLVDRNGGSGKINSEDKVYSSMLNGERLFLFTDKWFDNLGLIRHDQKYDLAYLHDLKYFTTVLAVNFEKAFIRVSCWKNQDSRKKILSNKKSTSFIGQNSIDLKTDDMKQMGYFAKFEIRSNANVYTDPFQIWISGKLMEQINLEPLQVLRMINGMDIFDMTPEEYEQWQKEISDLITEDLIKEIEKKSTGKIKRSSSGNITRLYREIIMKKNALYIHGFMGNPKGGTFETLKKTLTKWNIHSIPFPDLHTDVKKTQCLIRDYCKSEKVDLLIGASLGAFYVLQYEEIIDKLVINPCLYPSIEIPKLRDRSTGNPIILSDKVLADFREMEKYKDIPEEQKRRSFGIFAKDDELFHFKDSFDKLFQYKEDFYQNSILIKGHHSIEEEYLADGLKQAEKYF